MPRWEPDARLRLLESALELFEQQGYDDTGVAEIAERAGLTKTTFFRHFSDKREVLFAGQELHCQLLSDAVADAPAQATPLEAVGAALHALASTLPSDRHAFAVRVQGVIDEHSDLQERAALKRAGYLAAISTALRERSVPETTTAVAADLGLLAFHTAYTRWVKGPSGASLTDLTREALDDLRSASAALS